MMENEELTIVNSTPKKEWQKPEFAVIAKDEIVSGNTSGGAEGVATPYVPGWFYYS